MHILLQTNDPNLALHFRDYIQQHFQQTIVLEERDHIIFVEVEDCPNLSAIFQEATRFLEDPFHERYQQASWKNVQTFSLSQLYLHFFSKKETSSGVTYRKTVPFTWFVTLLCCVIFILQLYPPFTEPLFEALHFPILGQDQPWQVWRYFSYAFVHLSLVHLIFNLVLWWIFAQMIERQQGITPLLILFFMSAIVSGILQSTTSDALFFGLSSVVYGVLTYVWLFNQLNPSYFDLPKGMLWLIVIGLSISYATPWLLQIPIANTAHIVGAIMGLLLAYWFKNWQK